MTCDIVCFDIISMPMLVNMYDILLVCGKVYSSV